MLHQDSLLGLSMEFHADEQGSQDQWRHPPLLQIASSQHAVLIRTIEISESGHRILQDFLRSAIQYVPYNH